MMRNRLRPARGVASLPAGLAALIGVMLGCRDASNGRISGDSGAGSDAGVLPDGAMPSAANVRVRFELVPGEDLSFGQAPWPDNLFLDDVGAPLAAGLPLSTADVAYREGVERAVARLDGFGVMGPVYFFLDGPIDPESLPKAPKASLLPSASVFVVDVDTNSPDTFSRVAIEVAYDLQRNLLMLVPAPGHVFAPGRRYAAVVTNALRDTVGEPVGPDVAFAALRDGSPPLDGRALGAARDQINSTVDTLESLGFEAREVVAMAVFRTQTVVDGLSEARDVVVKAPPPLMTLLSWVGASELDGVLGKPETPVPGLDVKGGVLHDNVGAMVHATLPVANLRSSEHASHGAFERGPEGTLRVKRVEDVPFTVFLPLMPRDVGRIPVVLFAHDWGSERSDALAIVDRFAASGIAVVAVDAPMHGTRLPGADSRNPFVNTEEPDGFGDQPGDPTGRQTTAIGYPPLHPFLHRDLLRQWALDHLELLRLLDDGDIEVLRALSPEYAELAFDTEHVAMFGMGMGASTALMVAGMSESVGAVAALFVGGHLVRDWLESPGRADEVDALLGVWGLGEQPLERAALAFSPAVHQMLLDGAEPLAWAATLRRLPVNVLVALAPDDEVVSTRGTEALARILGADFEPTALPGAEPFPLTNAQVSRTLLRLSAGTHDALLKRHGRRHFERVQDRFVELAEPQEVDNPTDNLVRNLVLFVESWRDCLQASDAPVCPARIDP